MTSDYRFTDRRFRIIFSGMKKQPSCLILLAAVLCLSACHRNDIRTATFEVDQLRTQAAVPLIANALKPLPGIQEVRPDLQSRTLTVVFNGRNLYLKNIEFEIVNAGFSLPHWPASDKAKAKLPKELQ